MSYGVARYLSIDSTDTPTFTAGGDLVFLADTTGTPQVWRLSAAGEWPERLTAHDERVSFVDASPTNEELLFGMDEGSNERDQLYRYDLETGEETAMTKEPEAKHLWGGWGPDGEQFAFAANRRQGDTFDVYVQGRDDPTATLVWEGPGGFVSVAAWHPDGEALVLQEANSSSDQVLYWLDVPSGEIERITDTDEEARYSHVSFGPEGGLYAVTDYGHETAYVGRIGVDESRRLSSANQSPEGSDDVGGIDAAPDAPGGKTGAVEVVERGSTEWNVDTLHLDAETGRVVYTRNVDGYTDLQIGTLEAGSTEITETVSPDLPDGVVADVTLSPDADEVAITVSADDHPHSIYVVDAESGESERWTDLGTLGIPESQFQRSETIRYETFDGREIPAYWTLPPGVEEDGEEQVPVMVDIHGGPEHQRRPWFYPTKQYFLNQGYAVLEPNVRGSSGYGKEYTHLDDQEKRLDSVKDIKHATEWLADQPAVDTDQLIAYGRSYGGFMVLAAITEYPDLWAAAVDFVGIADFQTFLENTGDWRRSHRAAEYGSLDDPELLERISPIHKVDRIQCPLFIQHGANDPRVPVSEAEQIAAAVEERGVPVETCIFEDEGHHTTDRENRIEEFERISAFLAEHV